MVGQSQYTQNRSKSMITVLNHIPVSDSYQKVKQRRNLMMSYAIKEARENIPLPSNMTKDKGDFTQVATDNSNYLDRSSLSWKEQKNYSASEVFQDASNSNTPRKPKVSETGLNSKSTPAIREELPCQKVSKYFKPKERPNLPPDMKLVPETTGETEILDIEKARSDAELREFLITCLRVGIVPPNQDTPLWQAVHTLVSKAIVPLSRVGFLPVIPKPITEDASCHQLCLNFENVRQQVNQPTLPVWCDEQVFDKVVDILLSNPEKFKHLFRCMGPLHMVRILPMHGSFPHGKNSSEVCRGS